jgi:hypothetical protein
MTRISLVMVTALILSVSSSMFAQADKDKKDDKKNTDETYTVHKSGDGGGGSPTYSTGGLNPNPEKPKPKPEKPKNEPTKDKPKK